MYKILLPITWFEEQLGVRGLQARLIGEQLLHKLIGVGSHYGGHQAPHDGQDHTVEESANSAERT